MKRIFGLVLSLVLTLPAAAVAGDDTWTSIAPTGGVARHFAGNGGDIYFASYTSIYRSEDAGVTWTAVAEYPARINALAAHGDTVLASVEQIGVQRSDDGGATWHYSTSMFTGGANGFVSDVTIAPSGNAFAVHTGVGIYTSTDGGDHWTALSVQPSDDVLSVVVNPLDEATLFAGTSGSGVFKSTDGGTSWVAANTGLPADFEVGLLDIGPNGETLLLGGGGDPSHFYRSGDAGASWQLVTVNLNAHFPFAAAFDAADAETMYAAFVANGVDPRPRVYASKDGGVTWSAVANPDAAYPPEVYGLHFDNGILIAGTLRGIFSSVDGGANWQSANTGFANTSVYDFALSATQPGHLYATSTGDLLGGQAGVFRSGDGGASWQVRNGDLELHPEGFTAISVNPHLDDAAVVARHHDRRGEGHPSIYSTVDAGMTWIADANAVTEWGPRVIAHHPTDPMIVFALAEDGVLRSVDGGMSWAIHSTGLPTTGATLRHVLVIAPSNPEVLYAGTPEGVYRSDDGGITWEARQGTLTEATPIALAIHPEDENVVYAGFDNVRGLFRSTDGGVAWTRRVDLEPVHAIALDPAAPERMLFVARHPLGAHHNVYASTDGGASFINLSDGFRSREPQGMTETWTKVIFDPHVGDRYYALAGGALQVYDGSFTTDVSITLSVSTQTVDVGDEVVAEWEVTNVGDATATDIDVLFGFGGAFGQGADTEDPSCGWDWGIVFCDVESLAPGESASGTVTMQAGEGGIGDMRILVTPRQIDLSPEDNERRLSVTVNQPVEPEPEPTPESGGGGNGGWLWLLALLPMLRARPMRR